MVTNESCDRQFALTGFTRIERMELRMKIALLDGVCNENDVSGLFKVAIQMGNYEDFVLISVTCRIFLSDHRAHFKNQHDLLFQHLATPGKT